MLVTLTDQQREAFTVTVIILLIASILSNSISFFYNIKKQIRPIFRTCLISLACSDILTTILISTTYLSQFLNRHSAVWTLGEMLCGLMPFGTTMTILVNSLTLVAIALDRYCAIKISIKGTWKPGTIFCTTCVVFIWGLSAGIASPVMTSYFLLEFFMIITDPNNHSIEYDVIPAELCINDKDGVAYYYSIVFSIIFVPLLIAFVWLNSTIATEIWKRRTMFEPKIDVNVVPVVRPVTTDEIVSNDKRTTETNTISAQVNGHLKVQSDQQQQQQLKLSASESSLPSYQQCSQTTKPNEKKKNYRTNREIRQLRIFKAILIMMTVFLICRLPTWIFLLYKLNNVANSNAHWLMHYMFGLLSILNCVLNPFLYSFLTESIKFFSTSGDYIKINYHI